MRVHWRYFLILIAGAALAQPGAGPRFEVASVKPAAPPGIGHGRGMRGGPGTNDPGQITWNSVSLQDLLVRACDLKDFQIAGPAWLSTERYDVVAKVPPGTAKGQFQLMLQNLLVERFQLKAHRETREGTVYELMAGKTGPRFKESPPESATASPVDDGKAAAGNMRLTRGSDGIIELPASMHGKGHIAIRSFRGTEIRVRREGLGYLIERLTAELDRPVVDKTGLNGQYDYALAYMPDAQAARTEIPADERPPDLFSALQSQLGLKLEAKMAPGEVLVIDHAEKAPTEN